VKIDTDLLIIGAGPFGLSMAAYAAHWKLSYRSIGKPMEFWKSNMPREMFLRSGCDWQLDPSGIDTIGSFLKTLNLTAAEVEPLSLEFYLRYCASHRMCDATSVSTATVAAKPDQPAEEGAMNMGEKP
jgi:hypothetical protein